MICVGIDVSKGKSMVCILKPGGEVLAPPFEIIHSIESILSLVNRIHSFDEETRVVLEETGQIAVDGLQLLVHYAHLTFVSASEQTHNRVQSSASLY